MPYFERKPFAELQEALAGPLRHLDQPVSPAASTPLVQQAAAILQKESQAAPMWSPAVNTGALSLPVTGFSSGAGILPVVLQSAGRVGQKARISISIMNDSKDDVSYSFFFTDLIGPVGERIPGDAIRAAPDTAVVPASGAAEARFEIQIPDVSPGPYFGLAICRETQPAILAVTVSD